jgi:membrane fusion protein (multidrug efflux system)
VVIERDWVVERYGEPAVYVASGSQAVLKRLTLGKVIGNRVIVTSGLDEGDLMVTFGYDRLTEGTALEIKGAPGDSADQHMSGSDDR